MLLLLRVRRVSCDCLLPLCVRSSGYLLFGSFSEASLLHGIVAAGTRDNFPWSENGVPGACFAGLDLRAGLLRNVASGCLFFGASCATFCRQTWPNIRGQKLATDLRPDSGFLGDIQPILGGRKGCLGPENGRRFVPTFFKKTRSRGQKSATPGSYFRSLKC
jgi:hypothetical protein